MYTYSLVQACAVVFLPALTGALRLPHHSRTISGKGVGSWWAIKDVANMFDQKVSWTYNWSPAPEYQSHLPSGIEFVPMIGQKGFDSPAAFASIKAAGSAYTHILNYNEPDLNNITVNDAINLYPSLLNTSLKIGSPAPGKFNTNFVTGNWFYDFMVALRKKNYPLDFIALHYYSSTFDVPSGVAKFRAYIEAYHNEFNLPIWVTEYAMVDYSRGAAPDQWRIPSLAMQAQYAANATKMLQSLPYVERYAWFSLSNNTNQPDTVLYRPGVVTEVGRAYMGV